MLNRLLLATTNKGKIREIKEIFEGSGIELMEPEREIEVEEDGNSFFGKRLQKGKGLL